MNPEDFASFDFTYDDVAWKLAVFTKKRSYLKSGVEAESFESGKFWKIGLSETPYSAFPRSKATNLYVYFVELFSESCYS